MHVRKLVSANMQQKQEVQVMTTAELHARLLLGDLSPVNTKNPMLQKNPDRKELKGKVPTQSMYTNCRQQSESLSITES